MKRTVVIVVDPTGASTVQTHGFTGPACRDASRFLETALGKKTSERLTPQFHQASPVQTENRLKS